MIIFLVSSTLDTLFMTYDFCLELPQQHPCIVSPPVRDDRAPKANRPAALPRKPSVPFRWQILCRSILYNSKH